MRLMKAAVRVTNALHINMFLCNWCGTWRHLEGRHKNIWDILMKQQDTLKVYRSMCYTSSIWKKAWNNRVHTVFAFVEYDRFATTAFSYYFCGFFPVWQNLADILPKLWKMRYFAQGSLAQEVDRSN